MQAAGDFTLVGRGVSTRALAELGLNFCFVLWGKHPDAKKME